MSQAWRRQPWDPDVHSLVWQPLALVPGFWVVIQGSKPWPSGSLVCIEKQQPRNKAPLWWESALDQEPKDLGFPSVVSQSNVTQQTIQSLPVARETLQHILEPIFLWTTETQYCSWSTPEICFLVVCGSSLSFLYTCQPLWELIWT